MVSTADLHATELKAFRLDSIGDEQT
jgi:hypothetical protein